MGVMHVVEDERLRNVTTQVQPICIGGAFSIPVPLSLSIHAPGVETSTQEPKIIFQSLFCPPPFSQRLLFAFLRPTPIFFRSPSPVLPEPDLCIRRVVEINL